MLLVLPLPRLERGEEKRRTSIHDDASLAMGHSAQDFAHNHPIMTKLVKSSGHSVKKKSRKASEKVGFLFLTCHILISICVLVNLFVLVHALHCIPLHTLPQIPSEPHMFGVSDYETVINTI